MDPTPDTLADVLEHAFSARRPSFANEAGLHARILSELLLWLDGRPSGMVATEYRLGARDRLDAFVEVSPAGGIAVEVKTAGGLPAVARQLLRYAEHDEVTGILLVTTRSAHEAIPSVLLGKPCRVLSLSRWLL